MLIVLSQPHSKWTSQLTFLMTAFQTITGMHPYLAEMTLRKGLGKDEYMQGELRS